MSSPSTHNTHQSLAPAGLAGCWRLDAGHALSLTPSTAGVLRIAEGRVWVTMDMLRGDLQAAGDLFLVPGRGLVVQPGQRVVLESADVDRTAAAHFSWDPLPSAQAQAVRPVRAAGRWQQAVTHPLRDLGLALGQAGRALARLALGVVGLVLPPVRGWLPEAGRT